MNDLVASNRAPGLLCGPDVEIPPDVSLGANVILCRNTKLGPGCHIEHGAVIGRLSRVGVGSVAKPPSPMPTVLGPRTIVGSYAIICAGVTTGEDAFIGEHALVREGASIGARVCIGFCGSIGNSTTVGKGSRIQGFSGFPAGTVIEEDCVIGPYVVALASSLSRVDEPRPGPVIIRSGTRIGSSAQIMPGVVIGPNATVGAASFVTRDIPAGAVVAGVPARIIKRDELPD